MTIHNSGNPIRRAGINMRLWWVLALTALLIGPGVAIRAGEFMNLDFEQANLNNRTDISWMFTGAGWPLPVYSASMQDLFPGWRITDELDHSEPTIGYELTFNWQMIYDFFPRQAILVPGHSGFGVELIGGFDSPKSVSISQVGEIPKNATWITFYLIDNLVELRINGTAIPLYFATHYDGLTYSIGWEGRFVGDVSAFAGQNAELEFFATPYSGTDFLHPSDHSVIDDIAFVVPEPSTWGMLLAGLGAIGLNHFRNNAVNGPQAVLKGGI